MTKANIRTGQFRKTEILRSQHSLLRRRNVFTKRRTVDALIAGEPNYGIRMRTIGRFLRWILCWFARSESRILFSVSFQIRLIWLLGLFTRTTSVPLSFVDSAREFQFALQLWPKTAAASDTIVQRNVACAGNVGYSRQQNKYFRIKIVVGRYWSRYHACGRISITIIVWLVPWQSLLMSCPCWLISSNGKPEWGRWQRRLAVAKSKITQTIIGLCTFRVVSVCQFQNWSKWVRRDEKQVECTVGDNWQCDETTVNFLFFVFWLFFYSSEWRINVEEENGTAYGICINNRKHKWLRTDTTNVDEEKHPPRRTSCVNRNHRQRYTKKRNNCCTEQSTMLNSICCVIGVLH